MRFCVVLKAVSSPSEALSEFLSAVSMVMVITLSLGGMTCRLPFVGSTSLGDLNSAQHSRSFFLFSPCMLSSSPQAFLLFPEQVIFSSRPITWVFLQEKKTPSPPFLSWSLSHSHLLCVGSVLRLCGYHAQTPLQAHFLL